MSTVAIIGAGASGLAAAHTLRGAGHEVTLFEQRSEVGGRATTRKREGFVYDHGAQYIKGGSPLSDSLITERFRLPDLLDIVKPVWIFDRQGRIQEGDPLQNTDAKWTYRHGLAALSRRMAQGLDIRFGTPIGRIEQLARGWRLFALEGGAVVGVVGQFDQLLIAIPASQAVTLIERSRVTSQAEILSILRIAMYNPLISVMLGYRPVPQTRPYYALVNTDKAHAISWLAWEHEKAPERVPPGEGLLIAQMAPQYSRERWQAADEEVIGDVANRVAELLGESLRQPIFTDIFRWRDALPVVKADAHMLNAMTLPTGLAFCGDAFVGGRVHLALEHGILVAQELLRSERSDVSNPSADYSG